MNSSALVMSLLLVSAVAVGLTSFFVGTSANYAAETTEISEFDDTFNTYSTLDIKIKAIQTAISNTQVLNPLTWGNVVTLVINVFAVIFEIPGIVHTLITDMVMMSGFIPTWVIWLVEAAVLIMVVFGAFAAINKWRS